ncbi:elongation factor Ts [Desulfurobacterium pacificum]|jgi:elongation factor Ts|uniref:Elongation factor Ts n=1 Tax=Desulfurobacterium pacificum TaxID=240166 RepID=A0ABY1NPS1_9BACT|nr:translation elongation factor Ts [Desulfurobacterium pacificum]SMP15150.1 elongation factor Ts [Desulfurobacterium pacificum]
MAEITAQMIKELREKTGAGIVDCKKALQEANGDMEKAVEILRKKGAAKAAKKADRATAEGLVVSYIHAGGKVGVLLELNCETDFVARTEDFKTLGHEIAMQIAAMSPEYVSKEDVPAEVIEKEKEILKEQALAEGKPEHIVEKIVEGRLNKFYSEKCLLEQPWIKDDSKTIADLVREYITKLGENIKVKRFCRFEVGK